MARTSILDGIDVGTLRSRLLQMQQAYLDLTSGGKIEVASYAQADGARTVTYTKANLADLTQAILGVQAQIDRLTGQCINRRAPMRPVF
jgi:glycerol-3-phosphate dehydrogenase